MSKFSSELFCCSALANLLCCRLCNFWTFRLLPFGSATRATATKGINIEDRDDFSTYARALHSKHIQLLNHFCPDEQATYERHDHFKWLIWMNEKQQPETATFDSWKQIYVDLVIDFRFCSCSMRRPPSLIHLIHINVYCNFCIRTFERHPTLRCTLSSILTSISIAFVVCYLNFRYDFRCRELISNVILFWLF